MTMDEQALIDRLTELRDGLWDINMGRQSTTLRVRQIDDACLAINLLINDIVEASTR